MGWLFSLICFLAYGDTRRPELIIAASLFAIAGALAFNLSKKEGGQTNDR